MTKGKLERIILAQCVSLSGKYKLYLMEHIRAGRFCYDVCAKNLETNLSVSRHYNKDPNDALNKAEAIRIYDEYREKLQTPTHDDEPDDPKTIISPN